jgi:hypothetical protein
MKKLFTPKYLFFAFVLFVMWLFVLSFYNIRGLEAFFWLIFNSSAIIFFTVMFTKNTQKYKGKKDANFYFSVIPLIIISLFFLILIIAILFIGLIQLMSIKPDFAY